MMEGLSAASFVGYHEIILLYISNIYINETLYDGVVLCTYGGVE